MQKMAEGWINNSDNQQTHCQNHQQMAAPKPRKPPQVEKPYQNQEQQIWNINSNAVWLPRHACRGLLVCHITFAVASASNVFKTIREMDASSKIVCAKLNWEESQNSKSCHTTHIYIGYAHEISKYGAAIIAKSSVRVNLNSLYYGNSS